MNKNLMVAVASTAAFLAASPALAQTAIGVPIDVVLNVGQACMVAGGGGGPLGGQALLDFGSTTLPAPATIDSSTSSAQGGIPIMITCNSATVLSGVSVEIGGDDNTLAGVRRMQNLAAVGTAGEFASYRLYATAARSSVTEYTPGAKLPLQGSPLPNVPFEIEVFATAFTPNVVNGLYTAQTTMTVTF